MADTNYIVPGMGIIQDTEEGNNMVMIDPGSGLYQQQEADAVAGNPWYYYQQQIAASQFFRSE